MASTGSTYFTPEQIFMQDFPRRSADRSSAPLPSLSGNQRRLVGQPIQQPGISHSSIFLPAFHTPLSGQQAYGLHGGLPPHPLNRSHAGYQDPLPAGQHGYYPSAAYQPHSSSSGYHNVRPQTVPREPFIAVDPFRSHPYSSHSSSSSWKLASHQSQTILPLPVSSQASFVTQSFRTGQSLRTRFSIIMDAIPRQIYLHLLLRIPSLYFARVTRVFEDAELSMPDIKNLVNTTDVDVFQPTWINRTVYAGGPDAGIPVSPSLARFRLSWEEFIGSLLSEWQSQNILAVLLLSAVLTMLQIQSVEGDPVMRSAALLSLICALMSLLYGCVYMARFGTMNKMYKAASWAEEARKTRTLIWWNVWVFLAMPAIWLAWSIVFFIMCILCFIWRTGSTVDPTDPTRLPPLQALAPRIVITAVFVLGFLYFILIMRTLKRYGSKMDKEWRDRAMRWRAEGIQLPTIVPSPSSSPYGRLEPRVAFVPGPYGKLVEDDTFFASTCAMPFVVDVVNTAAFEPIKIVDMSKSVGDRDLFRPLFLSEPYIQDSVWERFIHDLNLAWDGNLAVPNLDPLACREMQPLIVADLIHTWNSKVFHARGMELVLSDKSDLGGAPVEVDANNATPLTTLYLTYVPGTGPGYRGWTALSLIMEGTENTSSSYRAFSPGYRAFDSPRSTSSGSLFSLSDEKESLSVPGPYYKTLQDTNTIPEAFSRKISQIKSDTTKMGLTAPGMTASGMPWVLEDDQDDWERFKTDIRIAWDGNMPVPNLTHNACLQIRSLVIADILRTWNTHFFFPRGVEIVLSPNGDAIPTPAVVDPTGSGINDRGYPPSPYVTCLNSGVSGLTGEGPALPSAESLPSDH